MVRNLERNSFEHEWWDSLVRNAGISDAYMYSWYLDRICSSWSILIDENNNVALPVPIRRKAGIDYVYTPVFLQRLRIVPLDILTPCNTNEIIKFLCTEFKFIDLSIISEIDLVVGQAKRYNNYFLSLEQEYDSLEESFSGDCRRNIRLAAENGTELRNNILPGDAINLFRKNIGDKLGGISSQDYYNLYKLMSYCSDNECGDIIGAYSENKLIYSLFYIKFSGRITLLFTSTSPESRLLRVGYLAVNSIVCANAGSGIILDFAGSQLKGVESFIRSFGSENEEYSRILRNNLSFPLKQIHYLKRRLFN